MRSESVCVLKACNRLFATDITLSCACAAQLFKNSGLKSELTKSFTVPTKPDWTGLVLFLKFVQLPSCYGSLNKLINVFRITTEVQAGEFDQG